MPSTIPCHPPDARASAPAPRARSRQRPSRLTARKGIRWALGQLGGFGLTIPFDHERPTSIFREARSGWPPEITPAVQQLLRRWGQLSPREFGVHRPAWTTASLGSEL